jgi:hypothetical protein
LTIDDTELTKILACSAQYLGFVSVRMKPEVAMRHKGNRRISNLVITIPGITNVQKNELANSFPKQYKFAFEGVSFEEQMRSGELMKDLDDGLGN